MKKLLLAALLLGATSAVAQVNTVPQVGLITSILKNPTYTATAVGLVPAASATDLACISAGASKDIHVKRIKIGGTAGTAVTTPFLLYMRSALDTAGTPGSGLDLPVAVPNDPNDSASGATLVSYTANPTVASSPLLMSAMLVDLPVTTAAGGVTEVVRQFGTSVDFFDKSLIIRKGTTKQLCVNLNGVTVSSGVLVIGFEWEEF